MSRDFQGVKCPKCGKKGLSYAPHPHAQGWKDYDRAKCRYCDSRFILTNTRADAEQAKAAPAPTARSGGE